MLLNIQNIGTTAWSCTDTEGSPALTISLQPGEIKANIAVTLEQMTRLEPVFRAASHIIWAVIGETGSTPNEPSSTAGGLPGHIAALDPHPQYTSASEVVASVQSGISQHVQALDPHPVYTTDAEVTTALNGSMAAHVAALNPHSQYSTPSAVNSAVSAGIAAHVALADPHPAYTTDAEVTTAISAALVAHNAASNPHSAYLTLGNAYVLQTAMARMQDAMVGNMQLVRDSNSRNISAALLNAAAANTLRASFSVSLANFDGAVHSWAALTPVIERAINLIVTDPVRTIAAPALVGTPKFAEGMMVVTVTFVTDAGVFKTYVVGDTVTVTVKVSAADTLLGFSVPSVVETFTVVA